MTRDYLKQIDISIVDYEFLRDLLPEKGTYEHWRTHMCERVWRIWEFLGFVTSDH
jgi:hypothetical protein